MQVLQRNLHIATNEMKANHFDSVLNPISLLSALKPLPPPPDRLITTESVRNPDHDRHRGFTVIIPPPNHLDNCELYWSPGGITTRGKTVNKSNPV